MRDRHAAGRSRGRIVLAVTGLVGTAIVILAVAVFLGRGSEEASRGPLEPMRGPDPGMGSVFALGVDPDGDPVYAGTRFGLFDIMRDGEATRVANRQQETHALAMTGRSHVLASGHPDPREDRPAKLGLIESTDGGRTWQSLSLAGEADLHVLRARHERVYGYDSGVAENSRTLHSSDGGATWTTRGQVDGLPQAMVAVDGSRIYVATDTGIYVSDDGARTFSLHYREQ